MTRVIGAGLALAMMVPAAAAAQALSCTLPADVPRPRADGPTSRQPRRVVPVAGYTLAVSWSPQYCRTRGREPGARLQCGGGNRFGFVLHGLWPDGEGNDWPQYCAPAALLSEAEIKRNLCATPSVQLIQHEYAKHGTCMGVSPARYFAQARALYARLRYPDMQRLSRRPGLTAGQLAAAVVRVNPGMSVRMLRITATRGGWLDELWVCLDKRGLAYNPCPARKAGLAPTAPVKIWRGRSG